MIQKKTVAIPVGSVSTPARVRETSPALADLAPPSAGRASRWRTLSVTHWLLLGMLAAFVLAAVFANWVAPHDPELNNLRLRLMPPAWAEGGSTDYLLGTDQLGRDMLSRVIYGARVSLMIAVIGTLAGAAIGVLAGLVSGYRRGAVDDGVMLLVDAYMALPFIVIAMAVIAMLGTNLVVIIILAATSGFAGYTRIARGLVLQISQEQYVLAARSMGQSFPQILLRHALPNMLAPLIVLATMEMSAIILLEAALSFLGFGIQPPTPSWGLMVSEGRDYLASSWWVGVPPGLAIMAIAMCISLLGDWLRDVLDPTTRV